MNRLREHIEEVISITDEEFDHIKTFFTLKNVRKNQFLVSEADEVKFEFLALDGIYKVFYIDENGKEHILQFAKKKLVDDRLYWFFQTKKCYHVCRMPERRRSSLSYFRGKRKTGLRVS